MGTLSKFVGKYGLAGFRLYALKRIKHPKTVSVVPHGARAPLTLRTDTSDINIFEQVFVDEEYGALADRPARTIIDAGANIGLAAVYFALLNPEARIIALEPESSNFELLQRNVAPYPNITALKKGLWHRATHLRIANPTGVKSGFHLEEVADGTGDIETVTVEDLLAALGSETVDLLKIDIEGGEKELFEAGPRWIERVRLMVIELHDRMKPGCSGALHAAVDPFVAEQFQEGENVYLVMKGG